jgi:pyruvate dehydrogenase phosphatase
MRRAAFQVFRTARRPCLRKVARSRSAIFAPSNGLVFRAHYHLRPRASPVILSSSMQFRALTGALVAAAVASGAFYAYNGNQSANSTSPLDQTRNLTNGANITNDEPTRKALVVGPGELYTGTITGTGPLAKETDDYGRKVLEMLDPDQTTAKLRKNEESWLVGRGQGVVRKFPATTQSKTTMPRRSSRYRRTWQLPMAPTRVTGCFGVSLTDTGTYTS